MDDDGREDLWLSRRSVPPPLPPPLPPAVPPPLPPLPPPAPWNGWWTLLWAVVVLGVWMTFPAILLLFYMAIDGSIVELFKSPDDAEAALMGLAMDGDFLGISTIITALITCPLCYYLGKWRPGFTGVSYLALQWPRILPTLMWIGITIACAFGFDFMTRLLIDTQESSDFMIEAIHSAEIPIFLILGVVLGAPFLEEFVFRGLLFKGWRHSALGLTGTLVVTSLLWTVLHVQYGLVGLSYIFMLGIIMGYAREKTGSIWVPIAMHTANNLLATFVAFDMAK